MSPHDAISDDEILLRRISPDRNNIKPKGRTAYRATSWAIRPRPGEQCPSWSRENLTSAEELLQIEGARHDITGWRVAALSAASVRELGLDVVAAPTEEDPGHCLIVETGEQLFTPTLWSELAKLTEIVYGPPDEHKY